MKKIRNLAKRITALFMAVMLLVLAGCGSEKSTENTTSDSKDSEKNEQSDAKGRYLESDLSLPDNLQQILSMKKLADGSIVIVDGEKGAFISKDNGESWEQKDTYLLDSVGSDCYVYSTVIGEDGSYFAMYYEEDDTDLTEENTEIVTYTEGDDGEATTILATGSFKYIYIDKDGNAAKITPQIKVGEFVDSIGILSDGNIVISLGENVYTVEKTTGELTELCKVDDGVTYMEQIGNILYLVGSIVKEYDLEAGSFVEDPVMDKFSTEKLKSSSFGYDSSGVKSILLCQGDEENSIYIGCSDGLYRHVIGGNVMEEVIKGGLTSLGDPSLSFTNLINLDNEGFLIGYLNYSSLTTMLKKYVYDSEAAAVPEKILEIYSLTENKGVKQAISEYQKNNSEVYVKYEVGLSEGSGMTKEDAIRNLNTELLSGEGPDIILLDGMPVKSYMEKGILADLSSVLNEKFEQNTFFENIVNSYKKEDKVYAIPSRFQIPVLFGDTAIVDEISDLDTLADMVQKLREENETGSITGLYNEKETLEKLYDVYSPSWLAEDNSIKKEQLTAFLSDAKRIYEPEQKGISEADKKEHEEYIEYSEEYLGEDFYLNAGNSAMDYLIGNQKLGFGKSSTVSTLSMDYSMITSVLNKKEGEQKIKLMPGCAGNVFIPSSVIGVCENSSSKELAMDFVSSLLSEEIQSSATEAGYPVNKKAFSASLENPQGEEESSMFYTVSTEDGDAVNMEVTWITEEEKNQLEKMVDSLEVASITDETIKEAVLELAPAALNGEKSPEDVANEIINKVQIYLSE